MQKKYGKMCYDVIESTTSNYWMVIFTEGLLRLIPRSMTSKSWEKRSTEHHLAKTRLRWQIYNEGCTRYGHTSYNDEPNNRRIKSRRKAGSVNGIREKASSLSHHRRLPCFKQQPPRWLCGYGINSSGAPTFVFSTIANNDNWPSSDLHSLFSSKSTENSMPSHCVPALPRPLQHLQSKPTDTTNSQSMDAGKRILRTFPAQGTYFITENATVSHIR